MWPTSRGSVLPALLALANGAGLAAESSTAHQDIAWWPGWQRPVRYPLQQATRALGSGRFGGDGERCGVRPAPSPRFIPLLYPGPTCLGSRRPSRGSHQLERIAFHSSPVRSVSCRVVSWKGRKELSISWSRGLSSALLVSLSEPTVGEVPRRSRQAVERSAASRTARLPAKAPGVALVVWPRPLA